MYPDHELIEGCKKGKPSYQRALYEQFAPRVMGVCRRYAKNKEEAGDYLQEAFIRVFKHIHTIEKHDALPAWIIRTSVHTAINQFHKNKKHHQAADFEVLETEPSGFDDALSQLNNEELIACINRLPDGYRVVFNLYEIEGYSHKEIADLLGIAEASSRSQLTKSKIFLKKMLETQAVNHYER
jgi:RNA polymerase sigma factor (sigma-70 family)